MKKYLLLFTVLVFFYSCQQEELKQFTLLKSTDTGISFTNNITETDSLNYFVYPYMYMGGGVSVGDINNDGLVDLYFTSNMESNALYINKGDLKFENITVSAGLQGDDRWFTGSTMVDVNADGYLDIYASVSGKEGVRNNLLYINNGDLTFTEKSKEYGIGDSGHTTQGTFLDYDKDGDLDLYLANYPPTAFKSPVELYSHKTKNPKLEESDILYRNNGDGTFTDVTVEAGILNFGLSLSATASDVNGDGWTDVYISNDFDSADFLYINNQDGTFSEVLKSSMNHIAQYGMGTDIADYNNDHLLDVVQVDMTPEDNRRSKANMSSMNPYGFTKMVKFGMHYQYMQNCLQLNRGNDKNGIPVFSEIARLSGIATTDWSWAVLFSDLDNDGWKDLMMTNGTRRDVNNRDYFLDLEFKKRRKQVSYTTEEIKNIPSEKISNYIFKNNRDLTFDNVVVDWGWEEKTFSNGAAYADLDNDGDLDFVINNIDQEASVYKNNNAQKNNHISVSLKGSKNNPLGIGSKVTVESEGLSQFQELTMVRGFQSSVSPKLHFGLGKVNSVNKLKVEWPDGRISLMNNINANQTLTVDYKNAQFDKNDEKQNSTLFTHYNLDSIGIDFEHKENFFDDYAKEPLLPHRNSRLGPGVAVADVNKDGLDDIYMGGAGQQSGSLYIQNLDGSFIASNTSTFEADKQYEDMSALFFDFDNDEDLDLYVVSGGNEFKEDPSKYQDRLYENDGLGNFVKLEGVLPEITSSGSRAKAADFDKDGDLDLFVGGKLSPGQYPWPTKSFLLKNENGIFIDVTAESASAFEDIGMINDAEWIDFNADGNLDLVLLGEWTPIMFFENSNGKFIDATEKVGLENTEGWWSSLAKADMDNDGDEDLIAGNLGLNYKYQASAEEPFQVFADDFDGNGRKDIVLSYYNFGKLFPVRGKSCSSQQMPSLKKKFKDYNSFSIAEVEDVYGEAELENAEIHYLAKSFASVYLENLGDGTFSLSKLPVEAQFSSINQIIIEDFDGDGHSDIVLGGNLYSSEIETTRNDSGIGTFLKGNGKGNFATVANHKTGLFLRGDIKDIALGKGNNGSFLVAVNNNEAPQVLQVEK